MEPKYFEFALDIQKQQIENYARSLPPGAYDSKLTYLITKYNELLTEARRSGYQLARDEFALPSVESEVPAPVTEGLWREQPVSIGEFISSEKHLNFGTGVLYRNIYSLAVEWARPDIREAWAELGKGSGKSTLCAVLVAYSMYKLLCYTDWRQALMLPIGEIALLNLSTAAGQAEKVMFTKIKAMFVRSQWFKKKDFEIRKRDIDFGDDRYVLSGNSGSTAWAGFSILLGILDEADFLLDNQDKSNAQELYDLLRGQALTRFADDYKLLVISSCGGPASFMERMKDKMQREGKERPEVIVYGQS